MEGGSCKKRGVFGIFAKKRLEKHGSCGPSFVYIEQKAVEFLKKAGINGTTISLELNSQEIREICTPASEMVVYGYAPMMISAGCVKKSIGRCDGKESITRLKDRYQKTFYVKNYCDTCYNIIYNTAPLVLLEQIGEIEEMGIHEIRLHFTIEDTEETKG